MRPDHWNRLSPWGIGTRVIKALPSLLPALAGVIFLGRAAGPVAIIAAGTAISVLVGLVPWLTTTWRVTEDQLELRRGLLRRVSVTARRDRIRRVDVTAGPVERVLGLRKVVVGTGVGGNDSALALDPISSALADHLSHDLLRRTAPSSAQDASAPAASQARGVNDEVLAAMRPAWVRFAPFSLTGFAFVAAGVGIGFRFFDDVGLESRGSQIAKSGLSAVGDLGLAIAIPLAAVVIVLVAVAISVLAYVLAFWGFRLVRRDDGALHTTRGLISTVATTIERKRVRGVQLHEPILMRIPGGMKLRAIATGTNRNPMLLPPAPRAVAVEVADDVLGLPGASEMVLRSHGGAALRRRLTRALAAGLVGAVVLVGAGVFLPGWWWLVLCAVAVLVLFAAMVVGRIRYAHLGSAMTENAVVLGAGTLARTRVVLEHDGIVGVVSRATLFQRRLDVETLTAATAAGGFSAIDLTPERSADMARRIDSGLIVPFLIGYRASRELPVARNTALSE